MDHRFVRGWSRALPLLLALPVVGCQMAGAESTDEAQGPDEEAVGAAQGAMVTLSSGEEVDVDPYRSLLVVDQEVRDLFSFKDVMTTLAQRSGVPGMTAQSLYSQWWDTQNDAAHAVTGGPHCVAPAEPYNMVCPRQEGVLATPSMSPFVSDPTYRHGYHALALINRFDLAPADGAHCGQYRIVFAKNSGKTRFNDRLLIAFEAQLPNPDPSSGLEGCRPVAEFWAHLSSVTDVGERAQALKGFYFDGLPGFSPALHPDNIGINGGRITANAFMFQFSAQLWQLREFKFVKTCPGGNCKVEIWNTNADGNIDPDLLSSAGKSTLAAAARDAYVDAIPSLLSPTLEGITLSTPPQYDTNHSDAFNKRNDYQAQISTNYTLQLKVTAKLLSLGVTDLTWQQVANRATTQSCAGCHQDANGKDLGGGLVWPESNVFTHIDEARTEIVVDAQGQPVGVRPLISPALKTMWLPQRKQRLESFLGASSI